MASSRFLSFRAVELLAAAVLGGILVLGGAAAFGELGNHTTIEQAPAAGAIPTTSQTPAATTGARTGLTAEQIYRRDAPGVVQITATSVTQVADPFNFLPSTPQTSQSLGSGFVIDKAGHIVTNYHVIQGAKKVQVSFSGQDEITATVVGKDPSTDVAILKIDAHARALTPLELGNSDAVVVGDSVYAIGNPLRLHPHPDNRCRQRRAAPDRGAQLAADRPRDPDRRRDQPRQLGWAADRRRRPRDRRHLADLDRIDGTAGQRRHRLRRPDQHCPQRRGADHLQRQGAARVPRPERAAGDGAGGDPLPPTDEDRAAREDVSTGSGAYKAGLKAGTTAVVVQGESYKVGGDIIVAINGTPATNYEQLRDAVSNSKPGDKMKLEIYRIGSIDGWTATTPPTVAPSWAR